VETHPAVEHLHCANPYFSGRRGPSLPLCEDTPRKMRDSHRYPGTPPQREALPPGIPLPRDGSRLKRNEYSPESWLMNTLGVTDKR
jgi:hypothetical protein